MDNIIEKIARKMNLDSEIIERIVRSEFRFVAETMQQGTFESVHLHYWGKYAIKPNAIKRINEMKANKNK